MSELQTDESAKNQKTMRTLRVIWMILIPVFALIILLRIYGWSQGTDNLRSTLAPLGMIFVGAASLIRPRNKNLASVLIVVALILVVSGLVLMLVY